MTEKRGMSSMKYHTKFSGIGGDMVNVTDIHSLTEFQRHAKALIEKLKASRNPLVLTVNGRPEKMLRCNFIMRGVQLPAGTHEVEFQFAPVNTTVYVSVAAWIAGLLLLGLLAVPRWSANSAPTPSTAPAPGAAPKVGGQREK